ncbi:MAG: NAD(P)/FAD-dependent oxidoreductase [Thermomicrobiales bacterium]
MVVSTDTTDSASNEQTISNEAAAVAAAPANRPHSGRSRVVIIGGGFAGLNAAKTLAESSASVTLIDRRNHHLFAPLLYQVATAQLSPANIAQPIRGITRGQKNLSVVLGEVEAIDSENKTVRVEDGTEFGYDYLIVAAGATHSYFGRDEWASVAPGLKTLEDALDIRRRILMAFEKAEKEPDPVTQQALLTFVVIGAGPTGVEMAGAIAELANHTLTRDFERIDSRQAKVILLEGLPRVLPPFKEELSAKAAIALEKLGVVVRTGALVTAIDEGGVNIGDERIDASTVVWAAGVQVSPITKELGTIATLDRAGRVPVERELHIAGHPEIFVIGDASSAKNGEGKPLPGVAPVAMQEGKWAAENIKRRVAGLAYLPFEYKDRGSMATIGRNHAVADIRGYKFDGFLAWAAWAFVHVFNLVGFHNRVLVGAQWLFSYFSYNRGARLITGERPLKED